MACSIPACEHHNEHRDGIKQHVVQSRSMCCCYHVVHIHIPTLIRGLRETGNELRSTLRGLNTDRMAHVTGGRHSDVARPGMRRPDPTALNRQVSSVCNYAPL